MYLRLPFSDMFGSIQEVYEKNRKEYRSEERTYYRGCKFSSSEIEYFKNHRNGYIQMEGFLSTSEREEFAETFVENALLKVRVPKAEGEEMMDYGFAKLTKDYSTHYIEEEVLFNAMNFFKIVNV